jgi:hypothetical protein
MTRGPRGYLPHEIVNPVSRLRRLMQAAEAFSGPVTSSRLRQQPVRSRAPRRSEPSEPSQSVDQPRQRCELNRDIHSCEAFRHSLALQPSAASSEMPDLARPDSVPEGNGDEHRHDRHHHDANSSLDEGSAALARSTLRFDRHDERLMLRTLALDPETRLALPSSNSARAASFVRRTRSRLCAGSYSSSSDRVAAQQALR